MSPERFDPERFGFEDGRATKESDCYALGMVILEVLTGQRPFQHDRDVVVMMDVIKGRHPERPQGAEAPWFTDDLWEMLKKCWSPQPKLRPTVETILEHLERGSMAWQPVPPTADDKFQADSNGGSVQTETSDIDQVLQQTTPPVDASKKK